MPYHPHPPNDPFVPWTEFVWGSRGIWSTTGIQDIFVMAHVLIPYGIRTVLRGHASFGGMLLNVFHFRAPTATPSAADCHAVNLIVNTWWYNNYKQMCNTGVEATDVVSTSIAQLPGPQDQLVIGVLGTRLGTFVTPNTTLCLKAGTTLSGRTNRGRSYPWPMVALDLLLPDEYRVTDTYRAAIVGVFNNLVGAANSGGYPLVVRSGVDRALKPIVRYVAVDDYIDAQDRRLGARGR